MIDVRTAREADTPAMANLLNEIIAIGGTTARTSPVSAETLRNEMKASGAKSVWLVATSPEQGVVGFQLIAQSEALPPDAAEISTFVAQGRTGLGIGSALFSATTAAARRLGYAWINANIRADNQSGLTYYDSRGFRDYGQIEGYRLGDGQIVDKILKRFDL